MPLVAIIILVIFGVILLIGLLVTLIDHFTKENEEKEKEERNFPRKKFPSSLSTANKGNRGEEKVASTLARLYSESPYCHLINDITIEDDSFNLHQIDHILIKSNGIFVIETKDWNGTIVGKDEDKEWTQISNGVRTNHLNPLDQNDIHSQAVEEIFPSLSPIPVVIMVKNNMPFESNAMINFDEIENFFSTDFGTSLSVEDIASAYQVLMHWKDREEK